MRSSQQVKDRGMPLKEILACQDRWAQTRWPAHAAPRLRYLWFDTKCEEAAEHAAEVHHFAGASDRVVDFKVLSYQDVFKTLRSELSRNERARGSSRKAVEIDLL